MNTGGNLQIFSPSHGEPCQFCTGLAKGAGMWYNNLKRLSGESAGNSVPLGFCRIPFENIVSHSVLLSQNCGGHIRRQSLRLCECGIITSKGFLAKARGTPFPWDSAESPFENIVSCPVLRQQNLGGFIRRQILADLWSWHNNLMKAAREKVSRHEKEELQ